MEGLTRPKAMMRQVRKSDSRIAIDSNIVVVVEPDQGNGALYYPDHRTGRDGAHAERDLLS